MIESKDSRFDWGAAPTCTCGIVAQCILQCTPLDLDYGWTSSIWSVRARCPQTGLRATKIMAALQSAGLETPEDFQQIEFSGEPYCPVFVGAGYDTFRNPAFVAAYLRTKAAELIALRKQTHENKTNTP